MKKNYFIFLLVLFCLITTGCSEKTYTKIGTSDFSIIIPEGYVQTDDEFDEDQIAYYHKDDQSIDFDVYQWDKESKYTLEEEAEYFASQYGTKPEKIEINGIVGMKYISKEMYEEYEYTVVNYMFEDEDSIIELSFWTIGSEEEYAAVSEIIETIKKN
jgi:hypothetical protein